jgi:hypothetical protein
VDNTGNLYCRIDLADFAVLAENWKPAVFTLFHSAAGG